VLSLPTRSAQWWQGQGSRPLVHRLQRKGGAHALERWHQVGLRKRLAPLRWVDCVRHERHGL
jgi:hypothetical protein